MNSRCFYFAIMVLLQLVGFSKIVAFNPPEVMVEAFGGRKSLNEVNNDDSYITNISIGYREDNKLFTEKLAITYHTKTGMVKLSRVPGAIDRATIYLVGAQQIKGTEITNIQWDEYKKSKIPFKRYNVTHWNVNIDLPIPAETRKIELVLHLGGALSISLTDRSGKIHSLTKQATK